MARLQLWNRRKGDDFKFFDRTISEMFQIGGTEFLVHKFIGTYEQESDSEDLTLPIYPTDAATNIQDLLLLENRDRKYDENVYSLFGSYNVQDNDFDLSQFGLFLSADTIFIQFHINDTIDIMGRKIMPGDVLELPHLRDDTLLDGSDDGINDTHAIPKLYKVEDANRSSEGFSPTWYPHIWRVKISPLTDSQEYRDILDRDLGTFNDGFPANGEDLGVTLKNLASTFANEMTISDAIVAEAERNVPNRNLEHTHLYVTEDNDLGTPYLFMTDGEPPNGALLLGSGTDFPETPVDGTWFLRTDYSPNVLYKRDGSAWVRKEVDWREKWTTANRTLEQFINNTKKVTTNKGEIDSKVGVSKIIEHQNHPVIDSSPVISGAFSVDFSDDFE